MKKRRIDVKWLRLTLVGVLTVAACATEPDGPPEVSPEAVEAIDAFLASATSSGRVPKVVAMAANREAVIYQGAFGKKSVAEDTDVALDSIFNLASMTKPITSVAAMILAERGVFHLDAPVSAYLPEWGDREVLDELDEDARSYTVVAAEGEITVRQLLSHTSGLAYNFSNPAMQALMDITGEQRPVALPLVAQPGTVWNYSPSTAVVGDLVSKLADRPLEEFLEMRIFDPLGMADTSYAVPAEKRDRVVTVHRWVDGALVEAPVPETVTSAVRGDGGLYGTAADYIRFLQMFLNEGRYPGGRLISEATVREMLSNQIGDLSVQTQRSTNPAVSADFPIGAGSDTFGLGFQVTSSNDANPDLRSAGSGSWAGIFNTHFWVDPERGIAAVILMQQLPFYGEAPMEVYQGFEERLNRGLVN